MPEPGWVVNSARIGYLIKRVASSRRLKSRGITGG
jgi:hypothetical protein